MQPLPHVVLCLHCSVCCAVLALRLKVILADVEMMASALSILFVRGPTAISSQQPEPRGWLTNLHQVL